MSHKPNFVVVGSGGGGGTIAWLLAKAGYSVTLLEQGPDITKEFEAMPGHPKDPDGLFADRDSAARDVHRTHPGKVPRDGEEKRQVGLGH